MGDREAQLASVLIDVSDIPERDLPTDQPWRDEIEKRLEELDISQEDIGRWITGSKKGGQSQISYILRTPLQRSKYVERLSAALAIPLPDVARLELAGMALSAAGDLVALKQIVANAELIAERAKGPGNSGTK